MEENKIPTIRFDPAYSGGLLHMDPRAWPFPTVFDIDGLEERPQIVPIVRDHDQGKKVGQTETIDYSDGKIVATGKVLNYGIDPDAGKVVELAKRGARLQASVATNLIRQEDVETIPAGETGRANGQTFEGPVEIVRKWRLKEISVVTLGADDDGTRVTIGEASRGATRYPEEFYAPRERRESAMNSFKWEKLLKGLGMSAGSANRAAARIGKAADGDEPTVEEVLDAIEQETEAKAKRGRAADGDEMTEEEKAALCAFAADIGIDGDVDKMDDDELKILEAAFAKYGKAEEGAETTEEEGKEAQASRGVFCPSGVAAWSRTKYPVDRLGKQTKPAWKGRTRPTAARVAEASLFTSNGMDGATLERLGYTPEEIDEAQRRENRTLSLRGLIYRTGEAQAGYCDEGKIAEVLQKARYLAQRAEYDPRYRVGKAAGQLSTVDIPNVLANVINKSMLNGVQMVDDPTDSISRVVAAKDFRPQYFINLLTSGEFADVKSNGEVENLKLSDTAYENSARMRGFEVRIGYETIANDDMNAIQEVPKIMGRKAGLQIGRAHV